MDAALFDASLTDRYPSPIGRYERYGGRQDLPLPFEPANVDDKAAWAPQAIGPSTAIGMLRANQVQCKAYRCNGGSGEEIEASDLSHVVMFFPDGISGECSWHDGEGAGPLRSLLPNTTLVNAAGARLSLRIGPVRAPFRLLVVEMAPDTLDLAPEGQERHGGPKQSAGVRVNDAAVRRTLLALLQEIESPGWNSDSYGAALLGLLLCQLDRGVRHGDECGMHLRKGGLPAWRLNKILALLEGDPRRSYSLAELAERVQLHQTQFCRAFKRSTGVSPHRYFLLHKIRCAKEMMRDHAQSLTQIALECGFSDSSHFSTVFRRHVGVSPSQFRRSL